MKIAGLQKVSLLDYPNKIAATVFLAGCNLDCGYCYNRWMIVEAFVKPIMSTDDLLGWLKTRVGRLDGVCVSGGEPTLQLALPPLLRAIKGLGFAVKLDTNGTQPERLADLLHEGLVDYVAMDLKAPLDARYSQVAGRPVNVAALQQSVEILRAWGKAYEFRTTVGPLLDEIALEDLAHEIKAAERWFLQPFVFTPQVAPTLLGAQALDEAKLRALVARLPSIAPGVRLRGID
jgi:pyruvate formate lyase activating enzyme